MAAFYWLHHYRKKCVISLCCTPGFQDFSNSGKNKNKTDYVCQQLPCASKITFPHSWIQNVNCDKMHQQTHFKVLKESCVSVHNEQKTIMRTSRVYEIIHGSAPWASPSDTRAMNTAWEHVPSLSLLLGVPTPRSQHEAYWPSNLLGACTSHGLQWAWRLLGRLISWPRAFQGDSPKSARRRAKDCLPSPEMLASPFLPASFQEQCMIALLSSSD